MGRLARLSPRVQSLSVQRVAPLLAKAGVVERIRGRAGVEQRERIRLRDRYLCQACMTEGRVRQGDEVDHKVALEDGGSNDDANLWLLCVEHHLEKTAAERLARGRGG